MSGIESIGAEYAKAMAYRAGDAQAKLPASAANNSEISGTLKVRGRVLETTGRTIALNNVAIISVGRIKSEGSFRLGLLSAATFAGALYLTASGSGTYQSTPGVVIVFAWALFALFGFLFAKSFDQTPYLTIGTSDGVRTKFTAPRMDILHRVREILTEKINADDHNAVININFEKGVIETLNAGSLDVGALVQGDNNQVAANSPGARVGTVEKTYYAENSPGAQVGEGNVATGIATHATISNISTVNYAAHLPTIADWRNFYAQHPDGRMIEQRLAELETLMKSGTPTPKSRGRLKDVALDLSMILQGYPAMVQVFRDIVRLAGF